MLAITCALVNDVGRDVYAKSYVQELRKSTATARVLNNNIECGLFFLVFDTATIKLPDITSLCSCMVDPIHCQCTVPR